MAGCSPFSQGGNQAGRVQVVFKLVLIGGKACSSLGVCVFLGGRSWCQPSCSTCSGPCLSLVGTVTCGQSLAGARLEEGLALCSGAVQGGDMAWPSGHTPVRDMAGSPPPWQLPGSASVCCRPRSARSVHPTVPTGDSARPTCTGLHQLEPGALFSWGYKCVGGPGHCTCCVLTAMMAI